jgi:ketosteroid isomerase-like protein
MQVVADGMAVTDVVLRFFELVDSKDWDHMPEVLTEDTTVRREGDTLTAGRRDA